MRDPKQTDKIFNLIKTIRATYPDLRTGQIIVNAVTTSPSTKGRDLFYLEDQEIIDALKDYLSLSSVFTANI